MTHLILKLQRMEEGGGPIDIVVIEILEKAKFQIETYTHYG